MVRVRDEEAGVFEVAEEAEVEDDADRQDGARLAAREPAIDDQLAETEIDRDRE
jgi:hypothetical protein